MLFSFIDYLWGIESIIWISDLKACANVYRLPMRDWKYEVLTFLNKTRRGL